MSTAVTFDYKDENTDNFVITIENTHYYKKLLLLVRWKRTISLCHFPSFLTSRYLLLLQNGSEGERNDWYTVVGRNVFLS